jgi:predicted transcriptional regulator
MKLATSEDQFYILLLNENPKVATEKLESNVTLKQSTMNLDNGNK